MKKIVKNCIIGILGIATSGVAMLASAAVPLPDGWYLEGNIGSSSIHNATYVQNGSTSGSGFGWNVNVGYLFMPYFAAEMGYTNYAHTQGKFDGTQVATGTIYSYYLAGKGVLPLSDSGFELFAKLGVHRIHSSVLTRNDGFIAANNVTVYSGTNTHTGVLLGIGAAYAFRPELLGNLQWVRAKGNSRTGDMDLASIGMSYNFG
ncbi:MAG: outer membrane beta-barrel protein [Gammaproteobacteria bacterium]|nr:outer membrane beta-barrel protein [Gammaproteobacteria bacterium]